MNNVSEKPIREFDEWPEGPISCDDIRDAVETTCNHLFERQCIVQWLSNHVTCPMCKREISAEQLTPVTIKLRDQEVQDIAQEVLAPKARMTREEYFDLKAYFKMPRTLGLTMLERLKLETAIATCAYHGEAASLKLIAAHVKATAILESEFAKG